MIHEEKSVSVVRKVGSVALLLGGAIVLYAILLGNVASLLQPGWPDGTFWVLSLVTTGGGIGIASVGVVLWNRWRLPSGVILLLLCLFTIPKVVGLRSGALQAVGAEAQWLTRTAGAFSVIAALLALMGIALLLLERRRCHQAALLGG
jgi:hypothetical protein